MSNYFYPEERIAIVGMGALMPDAENVNLFWNNILNKKVSIKAVPDRIMNKRLYYDPKVLGKANKNDKSYTEIAAILDVEDYASLSSKFRIPPAVAEHMDPNQHMVIYCVDQALQSLASANINKERTAVIMGTGAPGHQYNNVVRRNFFVKLIDYLQHKSGLDSFLKHSQMDKFFKEFSEFALKDSIPITEDTAPGILQNIIAARITNLFGISGPSYTVDAACASALAASINGVMGLLRREYDAVITGGADVTLDDGSFTVFSAINALSPDGSYPFDARANGFVMGLGGTALVLKRLEDAIRDGDRIYALISGYGQGSDGKGKHIAAPSENGQCRVIKKAFEMAQYGADTVEYIEAHGTGTPVGDVAEINALKKAFKEMGVGKREYCGISSVKSNIGHLRYAAGGAGLVKAAMALYEGVLPPTAGIETVNPKLELEGSPFYILTDRKQWEKSTSHPRRANVSAFGFGGADYHIALEEFRPEFVKKIYAFLKDENCSAQSKIPCVNNSCTEPKLPYLNNSCTEPKLPYVNNSPTRSEKESCPATYPTESEREEYPVSCPYEDCSLEVVLFSGNSLDEINEGYLRFIKTLKEYSDFSQTVLFNNLWALPKKRMRLAICVRTVNELEERWNLFNKSVQQSGLINTQGLNIKGIYFGEGDALTSDKAAWMFPGQASQYPNMLKEIYEGYPQIESLYTQVNALWKARYGNEIMPLIFGDDEEHLKKELINTRNTHPAVFLSDIAMFKLLTESGVKADYMIGHSLGEIAALYASGMLDLKSAVALVGERGMAFDSIPEESRGLLMSIMADRPQVEEMIARSGLNLSLANINSPEQTVVGGKQDQILRMEEYLSQNGVLFKRLGVSHAFHTELVSQAAESFYSKIKDMVFDVPKTKVMACHRVDFYPDTKDGMSSMPSLLKDQINSLVCFKDAVLKLYEKGVRVFVESGSSSVLTNLVKVILDGKDVRVVASNSKRKDSKEGYKESLAELFACGMDVCTLPSKKDMGLRSESEKKNNKYSAVPLKKDSIVYSGVSVGLPGTYKNVFSDNNFDLIFEGKNLIEMLTDEEASSMVDLNITRLIKNEKETAFKKLLSINDVIRLAGKLGKIDMLNDYKIDEKVLRQMTATVCAGVAAGYEALKDAGIPLVREHIKTSTGTSLHGRLVLPEDMQEDTGIIFANGFLAVEPYISEVSRYVASKFGAKSRNDLTDFYEKVIERVSDNEVRKLLSDWFVFHYSKLLGDLGEEDIYEFNRDFMALISSQANNRLAQFIGARGPNFHISAACSSTATAVTIAEDLIRGGHARRMIVIGAENATSKTTLPWAGGCFLSTGAATTSSDVFEAAVPFDKRRNGMILGAGALGLVMEKEEDIERRGMNGVCRILGTHSFNTAGHQSKIDKNAYCIELDRFMARMENEHGFDRNSIAPKTVYYSHETFSPREGGCAQTEAAALKRTFGGKYKDIKVINTKGITGHTMAASIEEAIAAKALQYQRIPPVVNFKQPDPDLEGLNLSQGGSYSFEYVIRMVAAYGGQGSYHLLQRIACTEDRIFDKKRYNQWLCEVTDSREAKLKNCGRILVAEAAEGLLKESMEKPSFLSPGVPGACMTETELAEENEGPVEKSVSAQKPNEESTAVQSMNTGNSNTESPVIISTNRGNTNAESPVIISTNRGNTNAESPIAQSHDMVDEILDIFSEITKYPKEMLDLTMEIEADLGIDTVKQATILSIISEKYGILQEESLRFSDYPTIGHILDMVQQKVLSEGKFEESSMVQQKPTEEKPIAENPVNESWDEKTEKPGIGSIFTSYTDEAVMNIPVKNLEDEVFEIVSRVTKYPKEMLEKDMELEADLGIDNASYSELLSMLGERFDTLESGNLISCKAGTIDEIIDCIKKYHSDSSGLGCKDAAREDGMKCLVKNSSGFEKNNEERELCLQIPVFVEDQAGEKDLDLKDCKIWVIGDDKLSVERVSGYLKNRKFDVEEFLFKPFEEDEHLIKRVRDFVSGEGNVIIDCSHIAANVEFDSIDRQEQEGWLFLGSEARFIFYKELSQRLKDPKIRIVCAVSMDGWHGYSNRDEIRIDPFYGALSGFYKGLGKEWGNSVVKVVDLGMNEGGKLEDKAIEMLCSETESSSKDCEIGYRDGKRYVFRVDYLDRTNFKEADIPQNPHFLITGGGHGISSEITRGLSRRFKAKFTIISRTELPDNIEELSKLDKEKLDNVKEDIKTRLEEAHGRVTPAMLEQEVRALENSLSIKRLIEEIESHGNEVLYLSCDVRCYEDLKRAIEQAVGKSGPVNILIHGAGIEKSRLLSQKKREEFREVFSVKAEGICNLYRFLDLKELKAAFAFSSISGRFGNEAQIDYCSANSFLSSFMAMVRAKHKHIYALSIAWSGWKDLGIAWRNEYVRNHSEEMGLNLIEPSRGTAEFINILTGSLETREIIVSKGLTRFTGEKMSRRVYNSKPMIDWVSIRDGRVEKAFRVFSPKRDAIIDHHRLGTVPLEPAVAYMEMGAQLHTIMFGESKQYCFRNVRIDKPLKFFREEPKEVVVQLKEDRERRCFDMEACTYLDNSYANLGLISLSSMNVSDDPGEYQHLLSITELENEPMEEGYTRESLQKFSEENKNSIRLGTLFIDDRKENNVFKYNKNGAVISMVMPQEEKTNKKYNLDKLLINPAFMDSVFQVCGIHSQVNADEVYLPWEAEEFGVINVPREIMNYKAYSRLKYKSGDTKVYDVIMLNERNEVCYYAKSVKMRVIHL
ncbi:MAG: SDR family NAD(P)-dependent oxidoreductase [Clostridium sp.]|nr:SDR family NAD(P)-dependent oxidoreductase [Clostridium sp.]